MNTVYLLTGGNMGDRPGNLARAKNMISDKLGKIARVSSVYETASWGITDQPDFLNQVVLVETKFSAQHIMQVILAIEEQMGRIRTQKNASRIIDIDILFFNNEIINETGLSIPHPQIQYRKFTLLPLQEIAPELYHPVLKKNIKELVAACEDDLEVKIYAGD